MNELKTTPSNSRKALETTESSTSIANNMAIVFADQIRKGLIPWYAVPKSLRSVVNELLDRGE